MFKVIDTTKGAVKMHAGDTGAYKVHSTRLTGVAWSADDRMQLTITSPSGEKVIKRYYRLDTALGNGWARIQFLNADTDKLSPGTYGLERRYIVAPRWDGTAPTGDVTDALQDGVAQIIDGDIVRTPEETAQTTLEILRVHGEV